MKVVILAGGYGTRLSEHTSSCHKTAGRNRRPSDHLAHHEVVSHHGLNEFVICLGYKVR